jgi:hypothetical protein
MEGELANPGCQMPLQPQIPVRRSGDGQEELEDVTEILRVDAIEEFIRSLSSERQEKRNSSTAPWTDHNAPFRVTHSPRTNKGRSRPGQPLFHRTGKPQIVPRRDLGMSTQAAPPIKRR